MLFTLASPTTFSMPVVSRLAKTLPAKSDRPSSGSTKKLRREKFGRFFVAERFLPVRRANNFCSSFMMALQNKKEI
jgi:hypothetical protein